MGIDVNIMATEDSEAKVIVVHARKECEERICSSTYS